MDAIIKTAEEITQEALKRMDILGLPEWVKREYRDNGTISYCDQFLGTSLTADQSEEVQGDIALVTDKKAYDNDWYVPMVVPYYAISTERATIVLAVEKDVVESSWNEWTHAEKDLKDGWVNGWIVENGKVTNGIIAFPLKWEPHRSGIKLIMPTEEELAEKGIAVR